jgi:acetylornithine deacetylase
MKGGVAAMIAAVHVIAEQGGLHAGRLILAAVVDEEHSSIGADAVAAEWRADGAVVTEPTDLEIAVGHKGFAWVEVEVHGKAAHGSRPEEGEDAILRMGRVLKHLEALDRDLQGRMPHPRLGTGSLHASFIEGGGELSSYPDRARLQLERRTLPAESNSIALDEVLSILEGLRLEDPSFRGVARSMFGRPAYELRADHELPQTLAAAIRHLGRVARVGGASFWTDAAVLGHAGIPSVLFGPGGAGLHSREEYVNIADVLLCRDALVELARRFCAPAGKSG